MTPLWMTGMAVHMIIIETIYVLIFAPKRDQGDPKTEKVKVQYFGITFFA